MQSHFGVAFDETLPLLDAGPRDLLLGLVLVRPSCPWGLPGPWWLGARVPRGLLGGASAPEVACSWCDSDAGPASPLPMPPFINPGVKPRGGRPVPATHPLVLPGPRAGLSGRNVPGGSTEVGRLLRRAWQLPGGGGTELSLEGLVRDGGPSVRCGGEGGGPWE